MAAEYNDSKNGPTKEGSRAQSQGQPPAVALAGASATGEVGSGAGQGATELYVRKQLKKAAGQIKMTELVGHFCLYLGLLLAYFLTISLIDHWVVRIGTVGRYIALLGLIVGSMCWVWFFVYPLLRYRLNLLYVAQTIERGEPWLKNRLMNFWLFRREQKDHRLSKAIYQTVEHEAATGLSKVSVEEAIDRSYLIYTGYFLVAVAVFSAVYGLASPKSHLRTTLSVLQPWSTMAAASRVVITEVTPGDVDVYQGSNLEIRTRLTGLGSGEEVTLLLTSDDRSYKEKRLLMTEGEGSGEYHLVLPPSGGFEQNLSYTIAAGDIQSRPYTITVLPAPTVVVENVKYDYPAYTQRGREERSGEPEIKAIEGTKVSLDVTSNYPLQKGTLQLWYDSEYIKKRGQKFESHALALDGQKGTGTFVLQLDPETGKPLYRRYSIHIETEDGAHNPNPIQYAIETFSDLPPEVEVILPHSLESEVPENGRERLEFQAVDPDYFLGKIILVVRGGGGELLRKDLLAKEHRQLRQAIVRYDFQPRQFDLLAGEEVTFSVTAEDNRRLNDHGLFREPNEVVSQTYTLRISPPVAQKEQSGGQGGNNEENQKGETGQGADPKGEGQKSEGAKGGNSQSEQQEGTQQDKSKQSGENQADQKNDDQKNDSQEKGESQKETDKNQGQKEEQGDSKESDQNQGEENQKGEGQQGDNNDQQGGDQKGTDEQQGDGGQGG
ncbi:MAG: hypothetical protein MPJ24_09545, partial [Pirellulaceae bacterium]|nr:hypothetical protein [Pirellulaceae bacterium]